MIIEEYSIVSTDNTPAGDTLWHMAHESPWRTERLFMALEEFVQTPTQRSCRVAPDRKSEAEIFMVPPRYLLAHIPDAAALVYVDHRRQLIELVHIFENYGGSGERAQWRQAEVIAGQALTGPQIP